MAIILKIFRSLKTALANGFQGIWRQRKAGMLSALSITAIMLLVGLILFTVLNINSVVYGLNSTMDEIVAYLYDDVTIEERDYLLDEFSKMDNIESVTYISKEQAIIDAKEMFGEESYIFSGVRENPLPASIVVKLIEVEDADNIVEDISSYEDVWRIRYPKELIDNLLTADKYFKIGGLIAVTIIVVISIFIISNVIKMAISSRGSEIEIMKYIGASESFIRGPFLVEGIFFSLLGCLISYGIIYFVYEKFVVTFGGQFYEYSWLELVDIKDVYIDILIIYISIGIGIGLIGSIRSIRKFLKV